MSYSKEDIMAKAVQLMGGELNEASERVLLTLCDAAANELERKLKNKVSREELGESFVTAAGMLAIALCMELENSGGEISSFRAGNISATLRAGGVNASAASLRKAAENMLSAYLDVGGFGFVGVDG